MKGPLLSEYEDLKRGLTCRHQAVAHHDAPGSGPWLVGRSAVKEQALFTQERLGLRPLVRVHTCWLAFLLVVNVTSWLSLWASREHPTWSIFEALLLLLVPILLYIVSYLAVPNFDDADKFDLRIRHFRQSGWMQGLLLLARLSGSIAVSRA